MDVYGTIKDGSEAIWVWVHSFSDYKIDTVGIRTKRGSLVHTERPACVDLVNFVYKVFPAKAFPATIEVSYCGSGVSGDKLVFDIYGNIIEED